MLDILIPTYNRSCFLMANLQRLKVLAYRENLLDKISILISDNCSDDDTSKLVSQFIDNTCLEVAFYRQNRNIGLEKNALFLLGKAVNPYVMYLGDDDYLASGYLNHCLSQIKTWYHNNTVGSIIPSTRPLVNSQRIILDGRSGNGRIYGHGLRSLLYLSEFGHQLSGIVFPRQNVLSAYCERIDLHNIYPFIFFLGYNLLRYPTLFAKQPCIYISVSNSKDWSYDDSGLCSEIGKNYKMLFYNNPPLFLLTFTIFIIKQSWRLRLWKNIDQTFTSLVHLYRNVTYSRSFRVLFPIIVCSIFISHVYAYIFYRVFKRIR